MTHPSDLRLGKSHHILNPLALVYVNPLYATIRCLALPSRPVTRPTPRSWTMTSLPWSQGFVLLSGAEDYGVRAVCRHRMNSRFTLHPSLCLLL